MNVQTISTFEVARLIDVQSASFTLLMVPQDWEPSISELRAEFDATVSVIDGREVNVEALLDKLPTGSELVAVITGLDNWTDLQFEALDINRSRLETGCSIIFALTSTTAARFLGRAPNIRSYIGANIFRWVPDRSLMEPAEVEERLQQLREHYQKLDASVIADAVAGTLPAEPQFIEWLILLGRGDLVR